MTKAVILAGSSKSDHGKEDEFKKNKALVNINERPMVVYIVEALLNVAEISQLYIIGPEKDLKEALDGYHITVIPEKGSVLDNILFATENIYVQEGRNLLLVTSDIPLITSEAISDFLSNCKEDYDLFYPIINKDTCEKKFSDFERTYVKFKEGYFTGGNVFFINPAKVSQCYETLDKMIALRKKPVQLAMLLGLTFVLKLFTGRLNLLEVERKVSKLLNIKGKAIITFYPELGTDIDKEADLWWVENNFFNKSTRANIGGSNGIDENIKEK